MRNVVEENERVKRQYVFYLGQVGCSCRPSGRAHRGRPQFFGSIPDFGNRHIDRPCAATAPDRDHSRPCLQAQSSGQRVVPGVPPCGSGCDRISTGGRNAARLVVRRNFSPVRGYRMLASTCAKLGLADRRRARPSDTLPDQCGWPVGGDRPPTCVLGADGGEAATAGAGVFCNSCPRRPRLSVALPCTTRGERS